MNSSFECSSKVRLKFELSRSISSQFTAMVSQLAILVPSLSPLWPVHYAGTTVVQIQSKCEKSPCCTNTPEASYLSCNKICIPKCDLAPSSLSQPVSKCFLHSTLIISSGLQWVLLMDVALPSALFSLELLFPCTLACCLLSWLLLETCPLKQPYRLPSLYPHLLFFIRLITICNAVYILAHELCLSVQASSAKNFSFLLSNSSTQNNAQTLKKCLLIE